MKESDDFVEDDFQPDDDFVEDAPSAIEPKQERTPLAKAGRVGAQYALGAIEGTPAGIAYDVAVMPASSKSFHTFNQLQRAGEDIEFLAENNVGKSFEEWSDKDKALYKSLEEMIKNPQKVSDEAQTVDLSIRNLASKATGVDLHPEGVVEKAANWAGFVRDPRKVKGLLSNGVKPKELTKALLPYPTDVFRGIGAGTALQMAEDGQFGPAGTMAAAVFGDIAGHGPKAVKYVIQNPKKAAATAVNLLTMSNTKKLTAQQLVQDFEKSNLNVDAGTLTGSPLVQMIQARLSQSGLTGTALENLRKDLSSQIVNQYKKTLEDIGEITFENNHQAAEAIKNSLKVEDVALNTQKGSLKEQVENAPGLRGRVTVEERPNYQNELLERIAPEETRNSYEGGEQLKTVAEDIKTPLKEEFNSRWTNFNQRIANIEAGPQSQLVTELTRFIDDHTGSLLLGESTAEARVLNSANNLLEALRVEGGYVGVNLSELIKTKRTLADIADWEVAGSNFESAYKKLVSDVDSAIDRVLIENPELRNEYLTLNADYSAYKSAFENKNVEKLFEPNNHNYNSIYKDFVNNPDKLRSLEDIFYNSERGEQVLNQIKRDYAQKIIEKPELSSRDIRDLQSVLGQRFDPDILDFIARRQEALEHPLPRAVRQEPIGINAKLPETQASKPIAGRKVSETGTESARSGVRRKMSEALEGKSSDQIMKEMDTIDGIRRLRKALQTTKEGTQLFNELARFKLAEIIDKKMMNAVTEQVNLGHFSNLLSTKNNRNIVKELLSEQAFERLELLQKNAGKLAESTSKFYNASKSGTTLTDMGLVGAAASGVMLGNPYMAVPAMLKIGGSYVVAQLLADPVFLRELKKAIYSDYPKKFKEALTKMRPPAQKAMTEAQRLNQEQ